MPRPRKSPYEEKVIPMQVRFPASLRERLEKAAARDRKTMNGWLVDRLEVAFSEDTEKRVANFLMGL